MLIWMFILIGVVFSALGALAPGMINLAVAERAIRKGFKSGVGVAIGASFIQFVYTFIAIYFIDLIIKNEIIGQFITWAAIVIFIILGVYYLRKKVKPQRPQIPTASSSRDFWLGTGVAAMNMLIIPTWIFVGIWMRGQGWDFEHISEILAIAMGSGGGAFLVFFGYAKLGSYVVDRMEQVTRYTNQFIGSVFILLATFQIFRAFYLK